MSESFQQFLSSQCPAVFPADFHHQLREKLSCFPRYLPASFGSEQQRFWPDLNTFTEDHLRAMLMYYPQRGCESVCVVFCKFNASWEVVKFIGAGADGLVRGSDYAEVLFTAAHEFGLSSKASD